MTDEPKLRLWVRCECGAGLWRRYPDRLEMVFVQRGGAHVPRDEKGAVRKRIITVPVHGAPGLKVTCERCGRVNESA
jgi:hypothetical protein